MDPVVNLDLTGRTALVTGATVAGGTDGVAVTVDLTEPGAADQLDTAVDVLVNNDGFQHVAAVERFPPERFAALQQVMVTAPFLLTRRLRRTCMRRARVGL